MAEVINGVDVDALGQVNRRVHAQPDLARFQFKVRNRWEEGGYSRTEIDEFYGAGEVQTSESRPFHLEADEPAVLLGKDRAPNAVEHLLNALATCVTGAMAYHAAARGIRLESIESELRGEIDIRGFLGISDEVRKGLQKVHVAFRVQGEGTEKELEELCQFSPVLDVVSHGTEVSIEVEKVEGAARQMPPTEPAQHPS